MLRTTLTSCVAGNSASLSLNGLPGAQHLPRSESCGSLANRPLRSMPQHAGTADAALAADAEHASVTDSSSGDSTLQQDVAAARSHSAGASTEAVGTPAGGEQAALASAGPGPGPCAPQQRDAPGSATHSPSAGGGTPRSPRGGAAVGTSSHGSARSVTSPGRANRLAMSTGAQRQQQHTAATFTSSPGLHPVVHLECRRWCGTHQGFGYLFVTFNTWGCDDHAAASWHMVFMGPSLVMQAASSAACWAASAAALPAAAAAAVAAAATAAARALAMKGTLLCRKTGTSLAAPAARPRALRPC